MRQLEGLIQLLGDRALSRQPPDSVEEELERIRIRLGETVLSDSALERPLLEAVGQLCVDLRKRGWRLRLKSGRLEGIPPTRTPTSERRDRRAELAARRREQLREPATRRFVQELERGRITISGRLSVFDLMRDGRDLSEALQEVSADGNSSGLRSAIRPYIQFVSSGQRCEYTGLLLNDIWRYFRHTWSNAYDSVPGRSMLMLVRDAATKSHSVIGIAALSSAAVKMDSRDRFLEWDGGSVLAKCAENPTRELATWIHETVTAALAEIYTADLIRDRVISKRDVNHPSHSVVASLRDEARKARNAYREIGLRESHKHDIDLAEVPDDYWLTEAESLLFRCKRAETLAAILTVRKTVLDTIGTGCRPKDLVSLARSPRGRVAIEKLVRLARGKTVGTALADLTVCGAIPPYNELLGGKLVAMLALAPEVVAEYQRRYARAPEPDCLFDGRPAYSQAFGPCGRGDHQPVRSAAVSVRPSFHAGRTNRWTTAEFVAIRFLGGAHGWMGNIPVQSRYKEGARERDGSCYQRAARPESFW